MKARNRVVTYLSPADVVRLDALVRRRDTSRAQIVRDLVREGLRGDTAHTDPTPGPTPRPAA